ncbi:tRNA (adenosine(37)-N6)-threonylcarbamoyltransferase complex dimerization subunit type 1 TsaB [Shewanella glacialimarina]|uniref:tRNA (adenosine(37)-N6)-threonylcarbamoyltransferase complex dimerization subunit type 1 TsaB n=1 Tax=Shewanella glacialimarina TaxID=2590884 RepID=UPI001CF8B6AB|nr:tRNA (adenosine(37)-N6)-threonylcarbamoyltransferase complex dimerization subunit type 1 TsaB [Shewanella glacialimarina]UCX04629.1 tRNA (adenosine(37)-N6)-threonylcarbamoyltransferase complex dimerization subunit type 1 TsaB [Shewanella glacialimarina]
MTFHIPLRVLALDTCTESCSAALTIDGKVYARTVDAPREHSQRILPMVDELLKEAQVKLADIDVIAYGRGPGSFTGIRICTSMTQGLALGIDLPVIGISTLAAMAQMAITTHHAEQVFCTIDARMNEVYVGQFVAKEGIATLVGIEHVCSPQEVELHLDGSKAIIACGTGFEVYPALLELADNIQLQDKLKYPDAKAMLTLAEYGVSQHQHTSVDELAPVYIRDKVTWKKLPGRE